MANVIDSLVVTLGLDAKGFAEGVAKSTEELASFGKRLAGMFLAVRGIEDVVGYFKDLHQQLAEIGFTSKNLGVAGTELRRLGEVSELFGGQMQDAADSVQNLEGAVFSLKYRGQMSESLRMLQRFGVAYLTASGHMRNFRDIAQDASATIDRQAKIAGLDKGERYQMALSFGFTGGLASSVAQGGKGLEAALNAAQVDQRALTEKTIQGQVRLDQSLTRLSESTAANSSALLAHMTPVIEAVTKELQALVSKWLPAIDRKLGEFENFLKSPPPWLKSIEDDLKSLEHLLGPTGSLVAGLGALSVALGAGGALVRILGTLITTLALAPMKLGAGAVGGLAGIASRFFPLAAAAGAGVLLGKGLDWVDEKLGGYTFNALGSLIGRPSDWANYDPNAHSADAGPISRPNIGPQIVAPPLPAVPPPTPTALRPSPATEQSTAAGGSTPPTAMAGGAGTNVQIDSITVNTRATDASGIAADLSTALGRKLLVSSADTGLG